METVVASYVGLLEIAYYKFLGYKVLGFFAIMNSEIPYDRFLEIAYCS